MITHLYILSPPDMGRIRSWFSVDKARDMLSAKPYQQQYLAKACSGRQGSRWHYESNHRLVWRTLYKLAVSAVLLFHVLILFNHSLAVLSEKKNIIVFYCEISSKMCWMFTFTAYKMIPTLNWSPNRPQTDPPIFFSY